jgi:hypothetical protein
MRKRGRREDEGKRNEKWKKKEERINAVHQIRFEYCCEYFSLS